MTEIPSKKRNAKSRDRRLPVLEAMKAEMRRSVSHLKFGRYRRPYFVGYLLRQHCVSNLTAKAGALTEDEVFRYAIPQVEVRVGSYRDDNTDPSEGLQLPADTEGWRFGPLDNDPAALRRMFWLLTDRQYKQSVREYLEKSGRSATRLDANRRLDDFSREEPKVHYGPDLEKSMEIDWPVWRRRLANASKAALSEPWIEDSQINLNARHVRQFFVNSEGTEVIQEKTVFALSIHAATTVPKDGAPLDHGMVLNLGRASELPDAKTLNALFRRVMEELRALRDAPVCSPYIGPALLGPDVTGVIFHEAIGHRLEGERLRHQDEGHTFKGKIGKRILPKFIQLTDDPSMSEFDGKSIIGHYEFDEQGVASRSVELVRNGVLKNYLLSRTPAPGFNVSNGHGRGDGHMPAQARMGVLSIKSSEPKTRDELKEELIRCCKSARKKYGLIIENIEGGLTNTGANDFQAFVERPSRVVRVNVDTGAETLVRGVEIVGTPLSTINKIMAMGDDYKVFNGFCGAESGDIPQSEISPSCVVSEIELQRCSSESRRPPLLPPPDWEEKRPARAVANPSPEELEPAAKRAAKKRRPTAAGKRKRKAKSNK